MRPVELVPIRNEHWPALTEVFWDTFVLGSPLPFRLGCREAYEDLVLDWYRHHPDDSRIVVDDDEVVGYVVVCTDQPAFEKAQRAAGLRYVRRVLPRIVGPMSRLERRFLTSRILDGFEAWRDEDPMAVGAHAHFNLARGFRSGLVVRQFVEHIDERCGRAGLTHWTGQINARRGQRVTLLRRYGFSVQSETANRTLTWLTRGPVTRMTVVREVGEIRRLPVAS